MAKKRIFIVDDVRQTLRNTKILTGRAVAESGIDAEIETFQHGAEAREEWQAKKPDIVLLDLSMPAPTGMEILSWWREVRELQDTRVIVVSNLHENRIEVESLKATFWEKTDNYNDFIRSFRTVLESIPAYRKPYFEHMVRLHLTPGLPTRINVHGNVSRADRSNEALPSKFASKKDEIDRCFHMDIWFQALQERGYELYSQLFVDQVANAYSEARLNARAPENLRLRFNAQLTTVSSGFELLFDRPPEVNGDFLALRHPLASQIDGLSTTFHALGRDNLNEAQESGKVIRFLLIAANLQGTLLPSVYADAEIDTLAAELPKWFRQKAIQVQVKTVFSKDASIEHLQELSSNEQFDILHFAGHATNQDERRNEPGLYLWKGASAEREQYLVSLPELEGLLKRMKVSFAFLNCCRGGVQRDAFYLKHSRLLGIAHAVLNAGTASVLCYRSSVNDSSASGFAMDMYKNLAEGGELDLALHATRRAAYERAPNDPIWLSAMLLDQAVST